MAITPSNVSRVISVATGFFWTTVSWVLWHDFRSGFWLEKGGFWILFVMLAGTCGMGFWVMVAPIAIKALRGHPKPWRTGGVGKAIWCFSSVPVVLFSFSLYCLLVYYRITE